MKKILLLLLLFLTTITSFAQQGEIIYRENVALVPDTNAYITPDSCMLFWHMIPWEYQNLYLDVDLDNVADFWVNGSISAPVAYILSIDSRDWENPASPLGWRITPCSWQDPNNDTISMFDFWSSNHIIYPQGPAYQITSPPYDTTMMLRYGLRNAIEDSVGNVTNYYGWLEVEGHWTHTWIEFKGGYSDTLTACITRLAYCTVPNYPLRWGQTRLDEGVEETEDMPITIHPNPTSGMITIAGKSISEVEVVNVLGQTVIKKICDGDNVTVDLSGQPAGVYLFGLIDNNGKKHGRKVVKE